MCGIAGVLYRDVNRLPGEGILRRMAGTLAHRGPDAEGCYASPGVGLAHRRLSVIDLSADGNQPMGNEDGRVQVVFNGEIYNYGELRARLMARGHTLRTTGDTETLVHLYEDEQETFLPRLRGMFAFAIWDGRQRSLLLGRDRLGIKPLFVYQDDEKLVFGSELKAILAHGAIDTTLDTCALDEYLAFGFIPGPRTVYRQVSKLLPGHTRVVSSGHWQQCSRRYWSLTFAPEVRRDEDWIEEVRSTVDDSVKAHMVADVPVGAFLSGGVDSGIVVARAARLATAPLHTFTIGFDEQDFSELPQARAVAERWGTVHHEEIVRPDATEWIEQLVHHYDEPFADSSALPTFMVAKLAARHVKVVLSGDGGDEVFGGYPRYWLDAGEDRIRRQLPTWMRYGLIGPAARVWPKADWLPRPLRARTRLQNLSLDAGHAYVNSLSLARTAARRRLLPGLPPDACRTGERVARRVDAEAARDVIDGMMAADVDVRLPDDYLTKVDRASMAFGLEVRPPLLDHRLLEMAARMPSSVKIRNGIGKWPLREAFAGDLPPRATALPKRGFEIPVDRWLRGALRPAIEDAIFSPSSPLGSVVNTREAALLYRRHQAKTSRQGAVLWSLLVLARWLARYRTPDVGGR